MKIKILIFFYLQFTIYYLLLPKTAYSKDPNFDVAVNSYYDVDRDGVTTISQ